MDIDMTDKQGVFKAFVKCLDEFSRNLVGDDAYFIVAIASLSEPPIYASSLNDEKALEFIEYIADILKTRGSEHIQLESLQ